MVISISLVKAVIIVSFFDRIIVFSLSMLDPLLSFLPDVFLPLVTCQSTKEQAVLVLLLPVLNHLSELVGHCVSHTLQELALLSA